MSVVELRLSVSDLTPGQRKFLASRSPLVLLAGGYGSGKTTALALKILQLKTENPDAPGLIVSQTWSSLWAITYRRLMATIGASLPKHLWPMVHDKQGECFLDFGDGVPIYLRSAMNPGSIDGLDVGWAACDELRHYTRKAHEIILGRVRVKCPLSQRAYSSTPAIGFMSEEFDSGKPGRELIRAPTQENLRNLTPDFIDNLRASYSPRLQRAVLEGEFTVLEGSVFEAFDPKPESPWFVDFEPTKAYLEKHKVMMAVDPGYRRSAWAFIVERGPLDWVVFDELMPDNTSDMAIVEAVNARDYPIDEIWCDPAGDNVQSYEAHDTFAALRQIRTRVPLARVIRAVTEFRSIPFGVDKLRVLLGGYEGLPIRIRFARRLLKLEHGKQRGILKDLSSYSYPEVKDGRPVGDEPNKDGVHDHGCDMLRYWAVGRWMTDPALRKKDPALARRASPGYKVA